MKPKIHGATKVKVTITRGGIGQRTTKHTIKTTWSQALNKYLYPEYRTHYEKKLLEKGYVTDVTGNNKSCRVEFALPDGYVFLESYNSKSKARKAREFLNEQGIRGRVFEIRRGLYILGVKPADYRKLRW